MNTQEFKNLTWKFLEALQNRVEDDGGMMNYHQVDNQSWIIELSDGNIGTKTEVFHMVNNGNEVRWKFAGTK